MLQYGFANKFYTLWEVSENTEYNEFNGHIYGSYTRRHFHYIKNISFDEAVVKSTYPGIQYSSDLRGQSRSFYGPTSNVNRDWNYLISGKYAGKFITDLVKEDFDYIVWFRGSQYSSLQQVDIIEGTEEYKSYVALEEAKVAERMSRYKKLVEDLNTTGLVFTALKNLRPGYKSSASGDYTPIGYYTYETEDGHLINVGFPNFSAMYYDGYAYGLPQDKKGKGKRMKNKTLHVKGEFNDEDGLRFFVSDWEFVK